MLAQLPPEYNPWRGAQYLDTGWFGILTIVLIAAFILFNVARARRNQNLYIRRIAGLNAIDEAVGRATEMGRPVVMVPGIGAIGPIVMQALSIFSYVSRIAGRFGTPIRVCVADAAVYTVAQEIIRDTYQSEGLADRYDQDYVRFISDRQFAFAAGVSGLILREQAAATFFLGEWYAESLIFAETANAIGAIQVAGSTQNTQTPFFIAACDYVLIGDEYYAASAYLTRQPVLLGSLIGQDWSKILLTSLLVGGAIGTTFTMGAFQLRQVQSERVKAKWTDLPTPRPANQSDGFLFQMLKPQRPDLTIDRPKKPSAGGPE